MEQPTMHSEQAGEQVRPFDAVDKNKPAAEQDINSERSAPQGAAEISLVKFVLDKIARNDVRPGLISYVTESTALSDATRQYLLGRLDELTKARALNPIYARGEQAQLESSVIAGQPREDGSTHEVDAAFQSTSLNSDTQGPRFKMSALLSPTQLATPSVFCCSSLFCAAKSSRKQFDNHTICSTSDATMLTTGPQLTQPDNDVWLWLARMARNGQNVSFNRRQFLRILTKTDGGTDREWLSQSLERLSECYVAVDVRRASGLISFHGNLIEGLRFRHTTRTDGLRAHDVELMLNPGLVRLFDAGWTRLSWPHRASLRGNYLALWFDAWVRCHREPFSVKVEKFHTLSGSKSTRSVFRRELEDALALLQRTNCIAIADVKDGKVHITRNAPHLSAAVLASQRKSGTTLKRQRTGRRQRRSLHAVDALAVVKRWYRFASRFVAQFCKFIK
jgi:hypothetical protein